MLNRPYPNDQAFARLQSAATGAATSEHNDLPEPTPAQAKSGEYQKAYVTIHGLQIAIENVRNSVRRGKSDGREWANRMQGHYGEFEGTKGNDGDAVDVFIGLFPESRRVWVINQQYPDGGFDEHKVMLGFATESQAREAYMGSFDRDWTGLQSMHPCSLEQLEWWLTKGDMGQAFNPNQLPIGLTTMEKTLWNSDAQPIGIEMHKLMYDIRRDDAGANLMLDAVTMADLMADDELQSVPVLDALVVEVSRMSVKMNMLQRVMEMAGNEVKPVGEPQISDPVKLRGVMQVAVLFTLSDGQTITVWFHNPDTTPAKLMPLDELISWKWMLNKKDITIVVAPERGLELNVREVARRIMRLAERNKDAFAKANAKLAAMMEEDKALDGEILVLTDELSGLQTKIEVAKQRNEDNAGAAAKRLADPTTPEGYAAIKDNEDALLANQDQLDDFFQRRLIDVRNALRELGWEAPKYQPLKKGDAIFVVHAKRRGAGSNLVGMTLYAEDNGAVVAGPIEDDLTLTPVEIAGKLDTEATARIAERNAEPEPAPVVEEPAAVEFEHAGRRIYPIKVRMSGEVVDRWAIAAKDGDVTNTDRLAETTDSAKTIAEEMNAEAEREASRRAERAENERIAAEAAAARAGELADPFFADMAPNSAALALKALQKQMRFNGNVSSVKAIIDQWFAAGELTVSTEQESRIKPMSRTAFNRADNAQQREHERRMKEGGMKTVYFVNDYDLGKTAYDYASHLLAQSHVDEPTGVEAVDAAYKFANATDAFKAAIARTVGETEYSPFASAVAIDQAATANGMTVAWDVTAAQVMDAATEPAPDTTATVDHTAMLDSAAEAARGYLSADAVLDFANVAAALGQLQIALDVVTTNEPINRAEGKIEQADLEAEHAKQFRAAIDVLSTPVMDGAVDPKDVTTVDVKPEPEEGATDDGEPAKEEPKTDEPAKEEPAKEEPEAEKKDDGEPKADEPKDEPKEEPKAEAKSDDEDDDTDPEKEWDATPESEDEPEKKLDGDFPGHPFRGNQHMTSHESSGSAVKASMRAKHAERKGDAESQKTSHQSAHYSHKAAALNAKGKAKKYHETMAKFHGQRGGLLDAAEAEGYGLGAPEPVLDAVPWGNVEGVISKGGAVVGRFGMGGDGKGVIYLGAEGDERVKQSNGKEWFMSQDTESLESMVHGLAADLLAAARAVDPVQPKIEKTPMQKNKVPEEGSEGNQKMIDDYAPLYALGMVKINSVGSENVYFQKDGTYYFTKLLNTDNYTEGQEVDLSLLAPAAVTEPDNTPVEGSTPVSPELVAQGSEPHQTDPAPIETPEPAAVEAVDPQQAADTAYLNSLLDGSGDLLAEDTFAKLEPMFAKYPEGTPMYELLERAAVAFGDAATQRAQEALAAK